MTLQLGLFESLMTKFSLFKTLIMIKLSNIFEVLRENK